MTNFSLVLIPFCLMVADTVGIANLFPVFYLCICLVGIILAVIIATYIPFFKWVSYPMGLYLQLFGVEEAFAVAPATLVGFTDMFISALLITGITSVKTVPDIYGTNADRDSVDRTLCEPGAVKSGKQRKCVNYLDKAPQIG